MVTIEQFIKDHPYFVNVEEDDRSFTYHFKEKDRCFYLLEEKGYNPETIFPVTFYSDLGYDEWNQPNWFIKLHYFLNDLYFKKQRVRMLVFRKKRPFINIAMFFSKKNELGQNFMFEMRSKQRIKREQASFLPEFSELLTKEQYTVSTSKISEDFIYLSINERNEGII